MKTALTVIVTIVFFVPLVLYYSGRAGLEMAEEDMERYKRDGNLGVFDNF